jgi:hypothetical protein
MTMVASSEERIMPAGSEGQHFVEKTGNAVASLVHAITKDGHLAAFARQGAKELGNAFGQAWPDTILVQEPGTIFSPTQGEIAAARHDEPELEHEI